MKKRKILILLLILLGVAGGIYYAATRSPGKIVLTGIVTTDEVIVSPEIQGRLEQLLVREGDAVTNGELLGAIQPQEQQADVAFYASSEQQSSAQVAAGEGGFGKCPAEFRARGGFIHEQMSNPSRTYDQARTAYDAAKARVDR